MQLLLKVEDILECRITKELTNMGSTPLCDLPGSEPISCSQFLAITEKTVNGAKKTLATTSQAVEQSVFDIVNVSETVCDKTYV